MVSEIKKLIITLKPMMDYYERVNASANTVDYDKREAKARVLAKREAKILFAGLKRHKEDFGKYLGNLYRYRLQTNLHKHVIQEGCEYLMQKEKLKFKSERLTDFTAYLEHGKFIEFRNDVVRIAFLVRENLKKKSK